MDIKIPEEQWGALVGAAVMQSITPENRDTLIKEAIRHLLTPERGSYSSGETPLQKAFNRAICAEVENILKTQIAEDGDLTAKIRGVIAEGIETAFVGDGRQKIVEKVQSAFARLFEGY